MGPGFSYVFKVIARKNFFVRPCFVLFEESILGEVFNLLNP